MKDTNSPIAGLHRWKFMILFVVGPMIGVVYYLWRSSQFDHGIRSVDIVAAVIFWALIVGSSYLGTRIGLKFKERK